jgi:hypothetical protein
MERKDSAVYLDPQTVQRVDTVASAEMRSRTNTVKWLLNDALSRREPVEQAEPAAEG